MGEGEPKIKLYEEIVATKPLSILNGVSNRYARQLDWAKQKRAEEAERRAAAKPKKIEQVKEPKNAILQSSILDDIDAVLVDNSFAIAASIETADAAPPLPREQRVANAAEFIATHNISSAA